MAHPPRPPIPYLYIIEAAVLTDQPMPRSLAELVDMVARGEATMEWHVADRNPRLPAVPELLTQYLKDGVYFDKVNRRELPIPTTRLGKRHKKF